MLRYERSYSEHTLSAYTRDIQGYFAYVQSNKFREESLDSASLEVLRSWVVVLRRQNLAINSIRRKIASLRSFFAYLLRIGVLAHNPCLLLASPKPDKRVAKFLSAGQMTKLMHQSAGKVDLEKRFILNINQGSKQDYSVVLKNLFVPMFYLTGMRIAELVALKDWQVDLAAGNIKVIGKGRKERYIPIAKAFVELLADYKRLREQIFPKGLADKSFWINPQGRALNKMYVYREVRRRLQLVSTEGGSPHLLRHTFATHLLNTGADINAIKTLLGHSSLIATQIYTHTHIAKLKAIYTKAHPLCEQVQQFREIEGDISEAKGTS